MKTKLIFGLLILAIISIILVPASPGEPEQQKIRQPAVAGGFYPADPKELGKLVDELLSKAAVPASNELVVALVAPHAGYMYSGGVAAHSYALLKGRKVSRVVVIAPTHIEPIGFAAVYDGAAYATPLGQVPVDKAFAAKLAGMSPLIQLSSRGHTPSGRQGEHALEVQLPFLQRVLGQFTLVPVVMGDQSYEASRALGVALAKLIQGSDTLIVASSDLSHFHPYDDAVKLDRKTLKAIEEWDYLDMSRNFERRVWEACGGGPIVAAMIAAERLGANRARVLKYANSGDVTGDRSRVVGYGAVALLKSPEKRGSNDQPFSLSAREKEELLKIARKSVETAVKQRSVYQCSPGGLDALAQDRGAFVTLRENGRLRGCIGYVAAVQPLCHTVRDVAALAALRDDRFPPVTAKELDGLEYEVSVLSPLRRVADIQQIRLGQHGLLVKKGLQEGLLLPQVPVEQGWDRTTFLEQACRKAGLPKSAWQDEETDLFVFSAVVFGKSRTAEPVTPKTPEPPLEPQFQKPTERPGWPGQDWLLR